MMRKASWVQRKTPVRLVSTTCCHLSKRRSSNGTAGALMPALLKSRSSRPNVAFVSAKSAATWSCLPTLQGTASAVSGPAPASAMALSSVSRRRPEKTTVQPSPSSACAAALPIPCPAPVTSATLRSAFIRCAPVPLWRRQTPAPACSWLSWPPHIARGGSVVNAAETHHLERLRSRKSWQPATWRGSVSAGKSRTFCTFCVLVTGNVSRKSR